MQRTSSKSQLGSGIQLSIPNSPALSIPLSMGDLQNSSQHQRQRKPSIHSIQVTKMNNMHTNSYTSPTQSIFPSEQNDDQSYLVQGNNSFPSSQGIIQVSNIIQTPESVQKVTGFQKSGGSLKGYGLINSIQQGCGQLKRIGSTQNSNDGAYTGNILQLGVSFSPLSSTHTQSNSNIQINNLLASSGHKCQSTKMLNNNILNITSPNNNYDIQRQNGSQQGTKNANKTNPQLTSLEQNSGNKQLLLQNKQQQLRKNFSSGNISTLQRSSGSVSSKKGFINAYINRSREPYLIPLSNNNQESKSESTAQTYCDDKQQNIHSVAQSSTCSANQQYTQPQTSTQQYYQDFSQMLSDASCQNSIHLYNKHFITTPHQSNPIPQSSTPSHNNINNSNTNSNSYEVIGLVHTNSNENQQNLPKQMIQPWINSHQVCVQPQSSQQGEHNLSQYFSQLSAISGEKPNSLFNENNINSELKPNFLSYPTSSNQLDIIIKDEPNSQNLSCISYQSNHNKNNNYANNNLSATTFQESVSDQKIETNFQGYTQITPFNYKQDNPHMKEYLQHSQSSNNLVNTNNSQKENTNKPQQMCKNHRFKNANHYTLKDQKYQEFYCYSCAVLLYSQGHELYQIDESLELNAMKMIGEQKRLQEIANKKEAIDRLLFGSKDLIPSLQNTMQSMDRKEGDIYKFLDTQERNIDSQFNKLIYELNQNRQAKLLQIYQCKQEIKQKYSIVNALCQQNLEELCKLHDDILRNYKSIVFELEESKVSIILQNYFSIWLEALQQNEKITKLEQLDVYKTDQNSFTQIKDQINFLCNNTLKRLQTTYIKLNNSSPCGSPLLKLTPNKKEGQRKNSLQLNSRSKSPLQQLNPSHSTSSMSQQRERRQSHTQINPSICATQKVLKSLPQQHQVRCNRISPRNKQQNQNSSLGNPIRLDDTVEYQNFNKNQNLPQNNIPQKPHQQQIYQNQERKIKSVQHSINLQSKSVFVSFDNKDAFKNHHENENNKENITYINGIQTVTNTLQQQRLQHVHHAKSSSQPQLIYIDLKDVQSQPSSYNMKNALSLNPIPEQQQGLQKEQSIPLEDCNTFRNREADYEIEHQSKIGDYLENIISQANMEKLKLNNQHEIESNLKEQFDLQNGNQQPINLQQNIQSDKIPKSLDIYGSIQRQNRNITHAECDLETKVQGQTPNFSNKKKGSTSSPNKKNGENNNNLDSKTTLREFNYLAEEQKVLEDIVEKEKKSRDSSINKKKQFTEMIRAVQHNQIQRNLNCENILRRVSDNNIDFSQHSSTSTPSHIRSNSAQIVFPSSKSSMNSSKNMHFMGSEEEQLSEKYSKAIKKSTLDEILQSKNAITCEEIGRIVQKLSFEKNQNSQPHRQEYHNKVSIMEEESRISQTIVKSGVDNTYEDILQVNQQNINNNNNNLFVVINPTNTKNIKPQQNNIYHHHTENCMTQHNNPIITEDNEHMINPLKTTQNSEQKLNENSQRGAYQPFSQIIDY